jgi:hypothetical protein
MAYGVICNSYDGTIRAGDSSVVVREVAIIYCHFYSRTRRNEAIGRIPRHTALADSSLADKCRQTTTIVLLKEGALDGNAAERACSNAGCDIDEDAIDIISPEGAVRDVNAFPRYSC